jgi:uncharacterized protein with LGFP repeats
MHEDWQDSEGTRGHKYWGMGPEARKMVADRVKAKGGEGSEDLFELTFGQRQSTWCVCEYVNAQLCCMYVYVSVCVCT